MLILVSFNQGCQYFQAITFGRIGRGVKKAFYFFQSGLIVRLGFDGPDVHSKNLLSNRDRVYPVIFLMGANKSDVNNAVFVIDSHH